MCHLLLHLPVSYTHLDVYKRQRSDKARLIRDGIVVFTGALNALKRFKDDVKEVGTNFECCISLTNCNDIKVGDIIEAYEEVEVKQTL